MSECKASYGRGKGERGHIAGRLRYSSRVEIHHHEEILHGNADADKKALY